MTKQWVVFRNGDGTDQALRQILRAESNATGLSMSQIMREALAVRYFAQSTDVAEAMAWIERGLQEASKPSSSTDIEESALYSIIGD